MGKRRQGVNRKMKFILLYFLTGIAFSTMAQDPKDTCVKPGSYIETAMKDAMQHELGVDVKSVNNHKTTMTLLSKTKVSPVMAAQLAKKDQVESGKNQMGMTWKDYYSTYAEDNVYNLIVKFTFEDNAGHKNIFIGSTFRNDDECSVGFGGYITVERGF
ncbi:hypothetical protein [Rahnella victoriana]|uniref:Shiga toxin A subunit n=1 Tax=Rahnella victoriana TaxID=1510570 RepID=A0ABS0DQP7_9GAMM|nr:hypothetical protein [Rahnella victoriana]MBF7955950.1 hypothetical protein [Rahnella victoriana]UHM90023.1 hypothetical protein J9880_17195 [Rahnella victoriana]